MMILIFQNDYCNNTKALANFKAKQFVDPAEMHICKLNLEVLNL